MISHPDGSAPEAAALARQRPAARQWIGAPRRGAHAALDVADLSRSFHGRLTPATLPRSAA
jgi:hypothetical protein